jgi:hypothetical protein
MGSFFKFLNFVFVFFFHNFSRETHNMKKVIQTATHFGLGAVLFALDETFPAAADSSRASTGFVPVYGVR